MKTVPASARGGLCSAAAAAAVLPSELLAATPRLGGGEGLEVSLARIVAALIVCIIVALLAVLLIRQRSGKSDLSALFRRIELRPRVIRVVETRRLSPHADICVVHHGGREYLLLLLAGDARVLSDGPQSAGTEPSCG